MKGSTYDKIRATIAEEEDGKIIFTSDFASYGTPEAVKKAVIRLSGNGIITRLAHGIYHKPKIDTVLGLGVIAPTLDDIAHAIAGRDKIRIVPTGDYALNSLGLSTQVPANAVYITDGSPRRIDVGKGRGITFKHTSDMKALSYRSDLMMLIVSAMRTIGEKDITEHHLSILRSYLNKVDESDFQEDEKLPPSWVRKLLIRCRTSPVNGNDSR